VLFTLRRADFVRRLSRIRVRMARDGGPWVVRPKRASRIPTDVTEDVVREVALPAWATTRCAPSTGCGPALRLVIRRELRG
jgi:hypothetical protein